MKQDKSEGSDFKRDLNTGSNDQWIKPEYLTVGGSGISVVGEKLMSMLDSDESSLLENHDILETVKRGEKYSSNMSSMMGDSLGNCEASSSSSITRSSSPSLSSHQGICDTRSGNSLVPQLLYNQNVSLLIRVINRTVELLKGMKNLNSHRPAFYPLSNKISPGFIASDSKASLSCIDRVDDEMKREFKILKIELKMECSSDANLVEVLERDSIASLLESQIIKSIRHLHTLRERIEDTSSKVLVTGDLNAGKSTFCNALLRRKLLPEDQQPCTSIFCEVLDVRENNGVEEVHAVQVGVTYDRNDETTYEVFSVRDLDRIVTDNDRWSMCKIYVSDIRPVDTSLLNNGVVDIALIDAPGLNADSLKTTAVFARQEEIDVVVFVVSAANHFTQSAKEFISTAAREKAYMFMVVNSFDCIRDKKRCQDMILKQVAHLSPATFDECTELVHFVSSNAIPVGSGARGDPEDPWDNDDGGNGSQPGHNNPKGHPHDNDPGGKEREIANFEYLELALRRFVLEKRARSKLAPAKTYLANLLWDVEYLGMVNCKVSSQELEELDREINLLKPKVKKSKSTAETANEELNEIIQTRVNNVYNFTVKRMEEEVSEMGRLDKVAYGGIFRVFEYAKRLRFAIIDGLEQGMLESEEFGRQQTIDGVDAINSFGFTRSEGKFTKFNLQRDFMFRFSRRNRIYEMIDVELELSDFWDPISMWRKREKMAGSGIALTAIGVLIRRFSGGDSGFSIMNDLMATMMQLVDLRGRRLILPGMLALIVMGVSCVIYEVPNTLKRRVFEKFVMDYNAKDVSRNMASRISNEVRKTLEFPGDAVKNLLQKNAGKMQDEFNKVSSTHAQINDAACRFTKLLRETRSITGLLDRVDLEGRPCNTSSRS